MLEKLLLAILNSSVPGIGILGNIIEYISTDKENAGKQFIANLTTNNLPGGFITDFLTGTIIDEFFPSEISKAVDKIIPKNEIISRCFYCNKTSNYYVMKNNKIICSRCFSGQLQNKMHSKSEIIVFKNEIVQLHGELKKSNILIGQNLQSRKLNQTKLTGRKL